MIQIKHLCIRYQNKVIIPDFNFTAKAGEVTLISGRSGCGKSSVLSYIGCLETHPCQSYQYAHQEISHWNRKQKVALRREQFAYVFQERNLLSHLTVKETLALYAEVPHEKIQAYMQEVKLTHRLDVLVEKLSGGEKQRFALVLALLKDPRVLLADEPTNSVDRQTEAIILSLLGKVAHEEKRCVIIVSHAKMAIQIADVLYQIQDGRYRCWRKPNEGYTQEQLSPSPSHGAEFFRRYRKKASFIHQKKMLVFSLLAALLFMAGLGLWAKTVQQLTSLGELRTILINSQDLFTDSQIDNYQNQVGVVFVDYFYEIPQEDYLIQSYDAHQNKANPLSKGEILIDQVFADQQGLVSGDSFFLEAFNQEMTIKGIVEEPLYDSPVSSDGMSVYVSQAWFEDIPSTMLVVYVDTMEHYLDFVANVHSEGGIGHRMINESQYALEQESSGIFANLQADILQNIVLILFGLGIVIELVAYYTHLHDFGLLVSKGISWQELDSMLVLRAGRIALGEMAIALLVSILAGLFMQYIVFLLSAILAKHLCVVLFEHFFTTRVSSYRLLKW